LQEGDEPPDLSAIRLVDVALRWEETHWVAYNIGRQPAYAAKSWSTALGATDLDELLDVFRNSNVTLLPALAPESVPPAA
jgi:hypothetical protein